MAKGRTVERFSGWASSITISIAVVVIGWLAPRLASLSPWPFLASILVALLASAILYKLAVAGLVSLFSRVRAFRQFVLGRRFIEGVWVGGYRRDDGWHVTIENIDQTGDEISITGREFDAQGRLNAKWRSTSAALDPGGKLLSYSYDCEMVQGRTRHPGVGIFDVVPTGDGRPAKLDGYSIDTSDGRADPNTEFKAGPLGISDKAAFAVAQARIPGLALPAVPTAEPAQPA